MKFSTMAVGAVLLFPILAAAQGAPSIKSATAAAAQQTVPPAAQQTEADVERAVRRFRVGVQGGVGLDPEILDVGVHAAFGPFFTPNVAFRPGIELGIGEVTTLFGINLDVLYTVPGLVVIRPGYRMWAQDRILA